MRPPTVFLAGGGTGGHVYPLLAVAHALRALAPELRIAFVGTARGLEQRVVPAAGFPLLLTGVVPLRGGGARGLLRGVARLGSALPEGLALVAAHRPLAVVSVGGYAAGPVCLAASLTRVPLALIEPNSVMGLANRLVAPLAVRAYTAHAGIAARFRAGVALDCGVPIRPGFEPVPLPPRRGGLRLLVLGGSQGARRLNEALPAALAQVSGITEIVHQSGVGADEALRHRYAEAGVQAEVVHFIDDMPRALARAHLVISRAGASALAEITGVGRPSLLVPFPHAADDHQTKNAAELARLGAARLLADAEATPERLAEELSRLAADEPELQRMAAAARRLGRPDAAEVIAEDILGLAGASIPTLPLRRAATARRTETLH